MHEHNILSRILFYLCARRSLLFYSTTVGIYICILLLNAAACLALPCAMCVCVCFCWIEWGKSSRYKVGVRSATIKWKKRRERNKKTANEQLWYSHMHTVPYTFDARCSMLSHVQGNEAEGSKCNAQLTLWVLNWIPNYGGTWLFTIVIQDG